MTKEEAEEHFKKLANAHEHMMQRFSSDDLDD